MIKIRDAFTRLSFRFTIFSMLWYSITMLFSKREKQCKVPVFNSFAEIRKILKDGKLYTHDVFGGLSTDYLIHPRVIQCRLESVSPFGDCDDHAIYWCTAIKKSKLAKKVWFSFFTYKSLTEDKYSGHAVCVFLGVNNKYYWCDYRDPRPIEFASDFQNDAAAVRKSKSIAGVLWEVTSVKKDDTPVFGKITRALPGDKLKL